nr:alpha/beta hydrolase [Corynebacterium mendelii]
MRLLQAGDGHLVACFGDLDTAPAAVTLVSGVHSSQPETWGGILHRARGMHRASGAATIAWLGYRAPDTIAGAVSPVNGRKGARSLQRFQQSLHDRAVIRGHRQRLGIVGHSYGSFTAASAAQLPGGLWCDRMFLLGSPGIGTGDLADLHLRPTTRPATDGTALWAAINVGDPIAAADDLTGEILGKDPTEFDSGITVHVGVGGHSDYFTDPVFLRNLSALTTGG